MSNMLPSLSEIYNKSVSANFPEPMVSSLTKPTLCIKESNLPENISILNHKSLFLLFLFRLLCLLRLILHEPAAKREKEGINRNPSKQNAKV